MFARVTRILGLNTLQLIFVVICMRLIHDVHSDQSSYYRTIFIKYGWTGNLWAQGHYESSARTYPSFLCNAEYINPNDRTRIRAEIWDPDALDPHSPGGQGRGWIHGVYHLVVADDEAYEFKLVPMSNQDHRVERHFEGGQLMSFDVVRQSSSGHGSSRQIVNRYSYNCLEAVIGQFIPQVYTYQEHFIAEGTIIIEDQSRLQKRLLVDQVGEDQQLEAKLIEVYVKGLRKPLVHATDTRKVNFQIHDSPLVTASSSLMFCAWAGRHELTMKVTKKHDRSDSHSNYPG